MKLENKRLVDTNKVRIIEQGPMIWMSVDKPVPRWVRFSNGKIGMFDREAKREFNLNGHKSVNIEQCREGEFIIPPGLIYRPCTPQDGMLYESQRLKVDSKHLTDMIEHEIDKDAPVEEVILLERNGELVEIESIDEIKKLH